MDQKRRLDPLPVNEDPMWEHGEVHGQITPQAVNTDGEHNFIRVSALEVKCTHCDWGFYLDPTDRVKQGHVYQENGKLVV